MPPKSTGSPAKSARKPNTSSNKTGAAAQKGRLSDLFIDDEDDDDEESVQDTIENNQASKKPGQAVDDDADDANDEYVHEADDGVRVTGDDNQQDSFSEPFMPAKAKLMSDMLRSKSSIPTAQMTGASIPGDSATLPSGSKRAATDAPTPERTRKTAKTSKTAGHPAAKAIPLGKSLEECHPADLELLRMRDAGHEWEAIMARWAELTGQVVARTTLPNRYVRLRAYVDGFSAADDGLLLATKCEVEEVFEAEKWRIVQERVELRLGRKLPDRFCAQRFQRLMNGEIAEETRTADADADADVQGDGDDEGQGAETDMA